MAPTYRCPTCDVGLNGSLQHGFYCPHCNLLFSAEAIAELGSEGRKELLKRHFGQVKDGTDLLPTESELKKKRRQDL